jgi:hypothetical protein
MHALTYRPLITLCAHEYKYPRNTSPTLAFMKGSKWWNFNLLKPHLAAVSVVQYCSAFYTIDQPQSIRPLCAERIDRAVKWLLVQMALQQGRQTILAYVEIYQFGGNIDVHAMRLVDHRAAVIWAMRSAVEPYQRPHAVGLSGHDQRPKR